MVKLGELFKVTSGGTPSRQKSEYYDGGEIHWVKTGDLHNKYVESATEFITQAGLKGSSTRLYPKGTVLVAMYGATIGACSILNVEACTNQACAAFVPNKNVDIDFLYYLLKYCKPDFVKAGSGGAQPNISSTFLKDYKIPFPPLAEQKRIAAILDKADAIRRKRKQAIQLADDFLRAVFLDMFGDPITNPKGWEVNKFGDLGHWASGGTPTRSKPDYFEGEINWFSARELNHRYLTDSIEKITDEALNKSATKIFPAGSMLVGMYDTAAFKISILNKASASNQACANIIPNDLLDIEWFFSFIEFSKETYLRQRRGVRQKNLNLGMIKGFELPLPPKSEQMKFVHLAKKTLLIKEKNYLALTQSEGNFNSLSQKAFAGEL